MTSSGAQLTLRRFVRRYPTVTCSLTGAIGLGSYASYIEWNADQKDNSHESEAGGQRSSYEGVPFLSVFRDAVFLPSNRMMRNSVGDHGIVSLSKTQPALPRSYDADSISEYWSHRPITVTRRLLQIVSQLCPVFLAVLYEFKIAPIVVPSIFQDKGTEDDLQRRYAVELRRRLTSLGPAFVKAGQQLSIRPDLVPPVVLKELSRLCDEVEPVSDEVALDVLRKELGLGTNDDVKSVFEGLHLVASASLGQVYKGRLRDTGKVVAIKVQRPDMIRYVSLDLFLLQYAAKAVDAFTAMCTEQAPFHAGLVDTFARGSYMELDYENEASNQNHFRMELGKRGCKVQIPQVYDGYTTQRVLTTEWIDGSKLADAPKRQIRDLIPVGVELFLTQLLDVGRFHADPHPGNLLVTKDGKLCLLDFGLCADVDENSRRAMTAAIFHILTGDFDTLISEDAKTLGFLPANLDTQELKPILTKILTEGLLESGSNLHNRGKKLMDISNELNEVFFKYPFSVPPFFALVTRGLGLLEGIALTGDPSFDIFKASYPYASKRAMEMFGVHGLKMVRQNLTRTGNRMPRDNNKNFS